MMKKWILMMILFPVMVWSQTGLLERSFEATSKEKNPVMARQQMMSQATEGVAVQLIKEIIGEAKYIRNKALIQSKIVKKAARFIPFSKPGELVPVEPEGYKMNALLKVSVPDLQALLLENGLFYESDSTPVVLPAIRFLDRVNSKSYSWWAESDLSEKSFLLKQGRSLEEFLKNALVKHNFYLLKPQSLRYAEFLPDSARSESLRKEEWQMISQKLGAQMLIDGELIFSKSQERSDAYLISLRMTATQVVNSRVIAEVTRKYETEAGPFEQVVDRKLKEVLETVSQDLASQILEAWQKGSLGGALYKLTIRGRLPLNQQEAFKEVLKNKVREVKSVRERLISGEAVTYEVDSALGPKELGQKAAQIELSGAKLVLESASDSEVIYRISR